jgi:transcription elongation factor SPT4
MRACMVCSFVQTYQKFVQQGCPNCDSFLQLAGNSDAVQDCTSQVFDGLMTVSDTSKSWVARFQRLEGYVPGVYAVQVEGVLAEDYVEAAEAAGVRYIPRDGSVSEALPTEG